jgi:hypothetical protein
VRFLIPPLLLLTACAPSAATTAPSDIPPTIEPIVLSLSLYIVDEAANSSPSRLSSQRDVAEVQQIAERIEAIWGQANVDLAVTTITRVEASTEVLSELSRGETGGFLADLFDGSIPVPGAGAINGFYVRSLGSINGIAPFGSRVFLVTDEPTVHDERVSSHEIGHILGLHHTTDDSDRLMFSGTNGMELTDDEIQAARYAARGVADGLR